jgi:hypothetical protein
MSDKKWRDDLDPLLAHSLNELIKETKAYDYAIRESKDKSKAQLWVALALIYQQLNAEKLKQTAHERKIPQEELDKILKTLENL